MVSAEPSPHAAGREALLRWYAPRLVAYPWRAGRASAYRVLVSEVMLQQTQASRVGPAFRAFVRRFPTVRALAAATPADVLRAWGGLGYNRRAVMLRRAAQAIVTRHGGRVPREPAALLALPGVGPYTAAAVASIAFGAPVAAIDTNVRRVVARALLGDEPGAVPSAAVRDAADAWLDRDAPGAWNQALMDLGREICRPRPRCARCPLAPRCRYRIAGRGDAPLAARTRRPSAEGPPPFEGSFRQLRGAVVRLLRERDGLSPADLAAELVAPEDRVRAATAALERDGLVEVDAERARLPEAPDPATRSDAPQAPDPATRSDAPQAPFRAGITRSPKSSTDRATVSRSIPG